MDLKTFIGIDVSKEKIDVAVYQPARQSMFTYTVNNAVKEISKSFSQLRKTEKIDFSETVFCIEHTGKYTNPALQSLQKNNCLIWIESARQIKNSMGMQRGKNDEIDAKRIAEYACRFKDKLKLWQPDKKEIAQLKELLAVRDRLIKTKKILMTALNETKQFVEKDLYKIHYKASAAPLREIEKSIKEVEKQLRAVINLNKEIKRIFDLITSVEGIGLICGAQFIVTTNLFAHITDPRSFACYSGVASFEHTSGKSIRGKNRVSHLANKSMKTLLHMAAIVNINRKGELYEYYKRKVLEGKNKMLVINAMRNKIIHRVFAVVKRQTPYQKNVLLQLA